MIESRAPEAPLRLSGVRRHPGGSVRPLRYLFLPDTSSDERLPVTSFQQMARTASGHEPYRWQSRVAATGLPELLAVETGAGKTAGVVLPWLYRRRMHPDPAVRRATPHWLVFCLPLRVLVEQVESHVHGWLDRLGLAEEVLLHVAMGGRERPGDLWRRHPERDAVVLGTVDMLLSRALNRGYAMSRFSWPIDYGLFNNGVHWIFDEVQLLGPALPTSRQLQGLRAELGCALPSATTWMSATVDLPAMATVDNPRVRSTVSLTDDDRADARLAPRLAASKTVRRLDVEPAAKHRAAGLATGLLEHHRPGTLTLAVMNTVRTARELHKEVLARADGAEVVLLHSRFRPPDRRARVDDVLRAVDPGGPGRIVVSTQVVEAGVDLSAACLLTEAAPWPSIVQRAGRCNRTGQDDAALVLWAEAKSPPHPYEAADVAAAGAALTELEGCLVTATDLRDKQVPITRPVHAVLRRADLLSLFDTAPDLSGNDIDIAPFIRVADDLDVQVAWRRLGGARPAPDEPTPTADELCPVPADRDFRTLTASESLWRLDHLETGDQPWVRLRPEDVRPGIVVLADVALGRYSSAEGWDPANRTAVPVAEPTRQDSLVDVEERMGEDRVSYATRSWVTLERHLADVEAEVRQLLTLLDASGNDGLGKDIMEAASVAGRLHDIGKAHSTFADTMERSADEHDRARVRTQGPWAKSGGSRRPQHNPPFFRHELVSALALLGKGSGALHGVVERDLVVYLVAAHHGRVRLGIRSVPEEERTGRVLGVRDGDQLPAVTVPGGRVEASSLNLGVVRLGRSDDGTPSWAERSLSLLSREDLGPFRLSFLEAVVRLADWRASAAADLQS